MSIIIATAGSPWFQPTPASILHPHQAGGQISHGTIPVITPAGSIERAAASATTVQLASYAKNGNFGDG